MINKIIKKLPTAFISSLALLGIGLTIWYFEKESQTSLQNIFFWVGAIPIIIFSLGLFGDISVRGNPFHQFSRSVNEYSPKKRPILDAIDMKYSVVSGPNWIMAGLLVWIISYFV